MNRLETYNDIFKFFPRTDIDKTERVLSALQEYTKIHRAEDVSGIPIEKLKCTENDIKIALPVLEGIKNRLFPSKEEVSSEGSKGLMKIYMTTEKVTVTKANRLTGLSYNEIVKKSLKEVQLYLSKNKVNENGKTVLVLSNVGLKNKQSGEVYSIVGKRAKYIEILKSESPLTGKEIGLKTDQAEKTVWNAIQKINQIAKQQLRLREDLITKHTEKGYTLNPSYKIEIRKK